MFDFLSKKILNFFLNRPAVSAILINFIIIIFIPAVTLKKNVSEIKNYQVFPVEIISIAQKDELIRSQENYDENNEKLDNHPKNLKKTNVIESELLDYEKKTIKGFLNLNESLKIDDNNYEYSEPENIAANVGEKKNSENNYGSAIKNIEIPVQYSNIEKKTNNVFEERQFSEHEVEYKTVVIKKIKHFYPFIAKRINKEGKV
ncbi:hypothetical protein KA977_08880, partial [Candidatus Dependentiae bacterium]|nr:hypothetical protein [Candidatus Dependentiae bacterium]